MCCCGLYISTTYRFRIRSNFWLYIRCCRLDIRCCRLDISYRFSICVIYISSSHRFYVGGFNISSSNRFNVLYSWLFNVLYLWLFYVLYLWFFYVSDMCLLRFYIRYRLHIFLINNRLFYINWLFYILNIVGLFIWYIIYIIMNGFIYIYLRNIKPAS